MDNRPATLLSRSVRTGLVLALGALAASGFGQGISRQSLGSGFVELNGPSSQGLLVRNNQEMIFVTAASNAVNNDNNGASDVVFRSLVNGVAVPVSNNANNATANGPSTDCDADSVGRFVVFSSTASDIVAGDTNGLSDIFMRDGFTNSVILVSQGLNGAQSNGSSFRPRISADGNFIVYDSSASNLVAGDTNVRDIFVYSRQTGVTSKCSVSSSAVSGNGESTNADISNNGAYVVYESLATNLVASDSNNTRDIFAFDRSLFTTTRLSVTPTLTNANNASSNARISGNGLLVTYESLASNLVANDTNGKRDVFICSRASRLHFRISVSFTGAQGDNDSRFPSISDDGERVAYLSSATNLAENDLNGAEDVFMSEFDLLSNQIVTRTMSGQQVVGAHSDIEMGGSGEFLTFTSTSSTLVPGDNNGASDCFAQAPRFLANGRITFENYSGVLPRPKPIMKFTQVNGGTSETLPPTELKNPGDYAVYPNLTGLCEMRVKAPGYLWKRFSSDVNLIPAGRLRTLNFSLIPGDVNDDNEIGPADFAMFAPVFGLFASDAGYIETADLDRNGEIGPSDFSILATNFGTFGD